MKAVEFSSIIKNNQIHIPKKIQSEFDVLSQKKVKVIVLISELDVYDYSIEKQATKAQFLEGYADSDSIYDTIHK
jgi:hypothetical protein